MSFEISRIYPVITHLGSRIGQIRLCSTVCSRWTWNRMTEWNAKRFKAPLISPFFAINLVAVRLKMKCLMSWLNENMKNFQDALGIFSSPICSGQFSIILWSQPLYITSHFAYSPIYCQCFVAFVLFMTLYVINQ